MECLETKQKGEMETLYLHYITTKLIALMLEIRTCLFYNKLLNNCGEEMNSEDNSYKC